MSGYNLDSEVTETHKPKPTLFFLPHFDCNLDYMYSEFLGTKLWGGLCFVAYISIGLSILRQ